MILFNRKNKKETEPPFDPFREEGERIRLDDIEIRPGESASSFIDRVAEKCHLRPEGITAVRTDQDYEKQKVTLTVFDRNGRHLRLNLTREAQNDFTDIAPDLSSLP